MNDQWTDETRFLPSEQALLIEIGRLFEPFVGQALANPENVSEQWGSQLIRRVGGFFHEVVETAVSHFAPLSKGRMVGCFRMRLRT